MKIQFFLISLILLVSICGSTVTKNSSYIESPSYPSPSPDGGCSYFIEKSHPDICQYKLTFEDVVLANPFMGDCLNDSMHITGLDSVSAATVPASLCGDLTGHESKYYLHNLNFFISISF